MSQFEPRTGYVSAASGRIFNSSTWYSFSSAVVSTPFVQRKIVMKSQATGSLQGQ